MLSVGSIINFSKGTYDRYICIGYFNLWPEVKGTCTPPPVIDCPLCGVHTLVRSSPSASVLKTESLYVFWKDGGLLEELGHTRTFSELGGRRGPGSHRRRPGGHR